MHYLVAYDIANPKRLRRVARFMEKRALRCQKSVFWFHGDAVAVTKLLDEAAVLLDAKVDVLQAWQVALAETANGLARGMPLPINPAGIVACPGRTLFVEWVKN